jgi:hypothetical protein
VPVRSVSSVHSPLFNFCNFGLPCGTRRSQT